jgi:hypothetical protein
MVSSNEGKSRVGWFRISAVSSVTAVIFQFSGVTQVYLTVPNHLYRRPGYKANSQGNRKAKNSYLDHISNLPREIPTC